MKYNSTIQCVNIALLSMMAIPSIAQQKPNILFIAVDDLKPILGCYGDKLVKTPNIDRLAARGTVFMQNYCQQAVCGPTRASLMTGKRPDYTKVWDLKTQMRDVNPDILTLTQYLISQGYSTQGIGKIYDYRCVDNQLDSVSWSIPYFKNSDKYYSKITGTPQMNYQLPETKELIKKYRTEGEKKGLNGDKLSKYIEKVVKPSVECADVPDDAYVDGANVIRAKEILIELKKKSQPFFFAVGFAKPHLPFVAPKKYWDMYQRDEMPLAPFQKHAKNSPELAYHNSGELRMYSDIPSLASFTDVKLNNIGLPKEKQKELIHGYYAAISYMDAQVGKLLNALDSLGLAENTIIVLWGDHGWHLGDHDLWCKHTNFEQATKAPLLISAPGMRAGKTSSLTEFVDIFPTLCDLSNLKIPESLDGKSLVPIMKDPDSSVKEYAVSQFPHEGKMGYSIRTTQYRLTWWMESGFRSNNLFKTDLILAKELYDYKKDPLETINVVNVKKYKSITNELEKRMVEFFKNQRSVIN